jgi:hypothetical protein
LLAARKHKNRSTLAKCATGHPVGCGFAADWQPNASMICDSLPQDQEMSLAVWLRSSYSVLALTGPAAVALLAHVCPDVVNRVGAKLSPASDGRALSIIVTDDPAGSRSGAHCDPKPTLIVSLVGKRTVWLARPEAAHARAPRAPTTSSSLGAVQYLGDECDPAVSGTTTAHHWVGWHSPVEVGQGSALYIPEGWWHSVMASPKAVGLALDIAVGSLACPAQVYYLFQRVAPVPRRAARGWSSARTCKCHWSKAMQEYYGM